jgi:hypothetical protein
MEQSWYDDIIADLETFNDVFPTLTSFTTNLTSFNEVDGITISSDYKSFVYYALQYNFKTDKISYQSTEDEDGADMFKRRIAITFYEETPRLQKMWQLVLAKLETSVSEDVFNTIRKRNSVSEVEASSSLDTTNEQTSENKSAETPAQIYSTPQTFIDKYTNQMDKGEVNITNNQVGETTSGVEADDVETGGTKDLFSLFASIPKSVLMQVAQPFAKHFVSIYFN